jgi:hypothetical protein
VPKNKIKTPNLIYFHPWFCFGLLNISEISSRKVEESGPKISLHANWSTTGPAGVICRINKARTTRMRLHKGRTTRMRLHKGRMAFIRKNLQGMLRFNATISFQLGRSLSYKFAQQPRVWRTPFWSPFAHHLHFFHSTFAKP